MKKLITLIVVASLALTIQAQNVTNKLGTDGVFSITDVNDNLLFNIEETTFNAYYDFKNANSNSRLRLYNSAGPYVALEFWKSNGSITVPTNSVDSDILGRIVFYGYGGGAYYHTASIRATIDGTISGGNMPTNLGFFTSTNVSPTDPLVERMTIKADGTVNIADLGGSVTGTYDYVVVNDAGDLSSQAGVPSKSFNNQIQQLKEKNAALEAEMAELRKMLEMLMNEK